MCNTAQDGGKLFYASGCIGESNVDFLVDSGASSNFISQQLVQAFGLDVKDCNISQVALPDGTKMEAAQYIFEHVTLAGIQLPKSKFYILPILPATVLGLSFLQQRSVIADFASLKLTFKCSNKSYEVLGHTESRSLELQHQQVVEQLNSLSLTGKAYQVSCKQMQSLLKRSDVQAFCMLPNNVDQTPGRNAHNSTDEISGLFLQDKLHLEQELIKFSKAAIAALSAGCRLVYLRCPHCKTDHLDEGKWALQEHILHECQKCAKYFRAKSKCVGNPLAKYDVTLAGGKLHFGALQAQSSASLPHTFVQKASAIYDAHKHDVDQFVDNVFVAQNTQDIVVHTSPVKNILYFNSREGRDAHYRMYQRTTFYMQPQGQLTSPQVLAVNNFHLLPLHQIEGILQNENTLFLDNVFHVASHSDGTKLAALLKRQHNVADSKIVVQNSEVHSEGYCQFRGQILKAGSPLVFILSQKQEHAGLPPGASPHLLDVEPEVERDLRDLLAQYKDLFPDSLPQSIPPERGVDDVHHISVKSSVKPVYKAPYKTGPHESTAIKKELDDLLASGLIQPSNSPWASPVLLVKKPDGSLRFCIDYRGLNAETRKDKYPLPRTQELIDKLSNARYFSSFDLRSGYWQVKVAPSDVNKTAFTTRYGQFEWLVMPFGLTNAPSTFQRIMHNIFHKLLDKCVVVYLDDILVYSHSLADHKQHLRQVMQLLRQHKFYAKLKKCSFYQRKVTFLGHDIDSDGMHINDNKIKAVKEWPTPRTKRDVQRFVGFAQFFRQFIYKFSAIALPLTNLCGSNVTFEWTAAADSAFKELRTKLCEAPVLHIFDTTLPIEVHTDASETALSGILYQTVCGKLKPVAYHSRKFNAAECNYTTTERELLAIVDSCRHWRHYLYQQQFTVRTDHRPLQYFFSQPNLSPRQLRWAEYLSDFQPGLKILYLAGRSNVPADALTKQSQLDIGLHPVRLNNMSQLHGNVGDVKLLQEQDESLQGVRRRAESRDSRYYMKDGVIFTEANQLVVPRSLVNQILSEHHDHTGHFGIRRTIARIQQRYWFQHMEQIVAKYIKDCDICQRVKPRYGKPVGKLQPLPVPNAPWQHVSMDFITDMPVNSVGGTSIYVVVDRFSKQTHLIQLTSDTSAGACAKAYLDNIIRLHGVPLSIVSDRDPRFTARFWQELMRLLGTDLNMSTAFHPQTDGQTEITIRSVEQLLRAYCHAEPESWCDKLPQVELSLNTFPHTSTGKSPHEVVYNTRINLPIDIALAESSVPEASAVVQSIQECWKSVRAQLLQAQANMVRYTDKQRKESKIAPNTLVMLNTQNLQLAEHQCKKLKPRFVGPFTVVKQVGRVSYKLALPDSMRVHPVFHVSLLKPYSGVPITAPSPIVVDGEEEYVVHKIVNHRDTRGRRQYLVRWAGYDQSSDEWLDEANLQHAQSVLRQYKQQHNL